MGWNDILLWWPPECCSLALPGRCVCISLWSSIYPIVQFANSLTGLFSMNQCSKPQPVLVYLTFNDGIIVYYGDFSTMNHVLDNHPTRAISLQSPLRDIWQQLYSKVEDENLQNIMKDPAFRVSFLSACLRKNCPKKEQRGWGAHFAVHENLQQFRQCNDWKSVNVLE